MKTLIKTALSIALLSSLATAGNVISWVAPYFMSQTKNTLNQDFGGVGMKDGLSHLALQFWVPNGGQASLATRYGNITSNDIKFFTDWGDQNNVKTLLCVYNGENGWDWNLAVNSFANNRSAFVQSLVSQVAQYNLDGIEIDLEGPSADNSQKSNFIAFLSELRSALPADKDITVATFAYVWNAPNSSWWNDMLPYVDIITSMGYEEIGKNASGWASYATQKTLLSDPSKLALGMPTYQESWQGNTAQEQVDWAVNDGTVGVAIWDAALSNNGTPSAQWRSNAMWNKLASIAGNTVIPTSSATTNSSSSVDNSCTRTLVSGYQFNITSGSNSLAGYQENNYASQGGPFSPGDKVLPQGASCDQAITLDAASDTWNLYATSTWSGTTQNAVYLEKVTDGGTISSSQVLSSSSQVSQTYCPDYTAYSSNTNYSRGDVVSYQQAIYSAKRKTNKVPTSNTWNYVEACTDQINQSSETPVSSIAVSSSTPLSSSEVALSSIAVSSSTPLSSSEIVLSSIAASSSTPLSSSEVVLSSIAASSSTPLSSSEVVLSSIAASSSTPLSSSEIVLSSIAVSSSTPLSSSEVVLSSITTSSSSEDICSEHPEFVGGVTDPESGEFYTYSGALWQAQNNPGVWESPTEGWFWTQVGACGESPTSSALLSSIAASSSITQSSIALSSSSEIILSSSTTSTGCQGITEWSTITSWANFSQGDTFTDNGTISTCNAHPAHCYGSAGDGFANSYWTATSTCENAAPSIGTNSDELTLISQTDNKIQLHNNILILPEAQSAKVTVFDMNGKVAFSRSLYKQTKVELPLKANQTYFIYIQHKEGVQTIKTSFN